MARGRIGTTLRLGLLAVFWLASASDSQAIIIGGVADAGTFIPFGATTTLVDDAMADDPIFIAHWQQVYDSGEFAGITSISLIRFFESSPGTLNGGTYSLQIGYTSNDVNNLLCPSTNCQNQGLQGDFADNFNGAATSFATNVTLPSVFADGALTFEGGQFDYDPNLGNLLLDIQISDIAELGTNITFDSSQDLIDPIFSTVDNFNGTDNVGRGLITEFAVPEPSTASLLGLGLLGLVSRRRRRATRSR